MEEKVILDVQMESAQAIKNISNLRSKVDELRKAQNELTKDKKGDELQTAKNSEEYITLGEQIKSLNKQIQENSKAVQDNDKFTRNAEGSYNRLSAELARLKASYKAAASNEERAAILNNLTAVDERLKELDADQGVYARNVGNYKSALDGYLGNNKYVAALTKINDAFGASKNVVKDAGNAVKGFGKNMMAMLANPIVLGIAAIVLAVQQLVEAFKRNDEAMTATQKVIAPFKALWQSIQRLFDDIVKTILNVYNNLNKAAGGFSIFQQALLPFKLLIASIRAQFAILSNTLNVITKGVATLADGIRQRVQGSVIGKWVSNVQTTIRDLFSSVDNFLKKVAGSSLGKKLGLDTLYEQLKGILGTDKELMKTNKEIADLEYNINKKRADNTKRNAEDELTISQLRAKAAEKDKVSAEERIKLLSQAATLEGDMAKRNTALAQMEYDLQVKKNSLTESNAQDKQAEADAYANLINSQKTEYQNTIRINSQLASAREEAARDAESKLKEAEDLGKQVLAEGKALRDKYGLITDEDKLNQELAALEKALNDGAILREEYDTIFAQIQQREKDRQDKTAADELKAAQDLEEAKRQARVKFGLEAEKSEQQQELEQLQNAYNDKLLSEDEYQQALADLREKYRKQEEDAQDKADAERDQKAINELKERYEKAGEALSEWGGKTMDLIGSVFDAISAIEDAQMQRYVEQNDAKKVALQERLDSGLISQEEYDAQVTKLDEEQAKKEKELQLKQAKRQKAMAVMNATLNAAGAIIASLAQSPVAIGPIPNPAGIASLALATATGVAQVAAAAATPLPKASRGALLRGKSHAQGGIPIEAEGGEAIINARATKRYLPLLSAINQSTGGVPLYANGGIPQKVMRQTEQALFNQDQFLQAVASIKPQVAVTDINRGQDNMVTLTERRAY